jgi:colicin import membrane protein
MIGIAALGVICAGAIAIYGTLQKPPSRARIAAARPAPATIPAPPPRHEEPAPAAQPAGDDAIGRMLEQMAFQKPLARPQPAIEKSVAPPPEPIAEKPSGAQPPRMSAAARRELDLALASQINRCWTYPKARTIAPYAPKMKVVFGRDGSLAGRPVLLNDSSDPAAKAIAASAKAAMAKCKGLAIPHRFEAYYDEWKVRVIHFEMPI